jgi:uroporphyrinogen III methyltransferase/synthase
VEELDYGALAKFPGTLVFYMGITTAPHWARALIEKGKSASTPVAIVRRSSLPDQETILTTLGELSGLLQSKKLRPPAVVIVGEVVRNRPASNWFSSRPLFGKTVLVTRPEHQADELAIRLRGLGADVLCQPAIEISPPADWSAVDAAIRELDQFDWLVFSSSNGVHFFMQRMIALGHDARRLGGIRLAAIGPATVEALAEFHLVADVQPQTYRAEALAEALAPQVDGKRVLLLRASRGREVLAEMLSATGAKIDQVVVYESRDVPSPNPEIAEAMSADQIDYVTVTSSAIARSLAAMFGDSLSKTRLAAISPLTAEVLAELGHPATVIASEYMGDGLIQALLEAERGKT